MHSVCLKGCMSWAIEPHFLLGKERLNLDGGAARDAVRREGNAATRDRKSVV